MFSRSLNETILTYVEGSGLIARVTTPDYVLTHKYDGAGREKDVYGPGARHTHFEYDATGQVASVNRDGYVEAYTYDAKGRRDSASVTGQGTISSVYTDAWDVGSQSAGGNVIANFWYDSLHRPVKTQLPGGKESTRGYDAAGHVVRSSDPKQQQFWLQNADNGQPQALNLISGNTASAIQTYSFDGYVPTSDGSSSWHIDSMGRISDSSGGETFAYDHPRGFLTARNYGAAHLTYNYGNTPFVQSVTETASSTSVSFGRSAGGLLNSETYSNGIYKGYGYTGDMDVNYLEYTKNGTVLASFAAGFAGPGMRSSVSLMPGNEIINYGYDADKHINQETHSIGGVTTSTGYTYNSTGTRQTRTGHGGGTDTYHVNERYELTGAELGDGTVLACRYDDNGNTILKSRAVAGTLSVTYKNLTGRARTFTYTAAGAAAVKLTFPATQLSDGYKTILAGGMSLSGAVSFTVSPDEADASATISIARISAASTAGSWVREEDAAAIAGGVQREEDAQAPTGIALQDFGGTTQDSISWNTPSATPESFTYGWDALDQMTGAEHWLGDLRHDGAVFGRSGGWQIGTLTVNGDVREFKHGYDGSILSETTPANGTRTYINGGIDHVMWSLDSMGAETTKYWLNDINGSVYGLAGAAGNVLERQRMTAYGKVSLTDAAGAPQVFSTTGNRTGYQGLLGVPEVGVDNSRHRMYDPMTGRFLSRDPLGMVNGADVMNFCAGDPVNRTDPMGLWHTYMLFGIPITVPDVDDIPVAFIYGPGTYAKSKYNFTQYSDLAKPSGFARDSAAVGKGFTKGVARAGENMVIGGSQLFVHTLAAAGGDHNSQRIVERMVSQMGSNIWDIGEIADARLNDIDSKIEAGDFEGAGELEGDGAFNYVMAVDGAYSFAESVGSLAASVGAIKGGSKSFGGFGGSFQPVTVGGGGTFSIAGIIRLNVTAAQKLALLKAAGVTGNGIYFGGSVYGMSAGGYGQSKTHPLLSKRSGPGSPTTGIFNDSKLLKSGSGGGNALRVFSSKIANLSENARIALKHVEGHAVAEMVEGGLSEASLHINFETGPCSKCRLGIPELLTEGQKLWVIYDKGFGYFTNKGWFPQ